jgi:hypothetical protein
MFWRFLFQKQQFKHKNNLITCILSIKSQQHCNAFLTSLYTSGIRARVTCSSGGCNGHITMLPEVFRDVFYEPFLTKLHIRVTSRIITGPFLCYIAPLNPRLLSVIVSNMSVISDKLLPIALYVL